MRTFRRPPTDDDDDDVLDMAPEAMDGFEFDDTPEMSRHGSVENRELVTNDLEDFGDPWVEALKRLA